jgi:hypothetical protein
MRFASLRVWETFALVLHLCALPAYAQDGDDGGTHGHDAGHDLLAASRQTFRVDTFGDEAFWGDSLKLHEAIEGSRFGGVGAGVSPKTALAVGLKVDVDALPAALLEKLRHGAVNLDDPGVTLALLKLNAVVGVTGFFNARGRCARWASSAHCVTRASTTPSRRGSVTAWTGGPTEISTSARS